jgi:hypothetical protein
MPDPKPSSSHRRISGGKIRPRKSIEDEPAGSPDALRYEPVPPEERKQVVKGGPVMMKTIVVKDEHGLIVSVTKIAPDARFGVGIKPQPGQVVTEFEAGSIAEDPFPGQQDV